jgi:hypothetical protein
MINVVAMGVVLVETREKVGATSARAFVIVEVVASRSTLTIASRRPNGAATHLWALDFVEFHDLSAKKYRAPPGLVPGELEEFPAIGQIGARIH